MRPEWWWWWCWTLPLLSGVDSVCMLPIYAQQTYTRMRWWFLVGMGAVGKNGKRHDCRVHSTETFSKSIQRMLSAQTQVCALADRRCIAHYFVYIDTWNLSAHIYVNIVNGSHCTLPPLSLAQLTCSRRNECALYAVLLSDAVCTVCWLQHKLCGMLWA